MFPFRKRFSVRAGKAYWRWFQENEQSIIATMLLYSPICRILRSNSSLAAMAV